MRTTHFPERNMMSHDRTCTYCGHMTCRCDAQTGAKTTDQSAISSGRMFQPPGTMSEAIERRATLVADVMNIECQLCVFTNEHKDHKRWRAKARSSLAYKKEELLFLNNWIKERRRAIEANKLGVFDPNSPKELLMRAKIIINNTLDGDDSQLGALYSMIDQYLNHAA